jgi:hypothetical protein
MKSAHPKRLIVAVSILAVGASVLCAATSPEVATIRKTLKAESAIEMPAKAAQIVNQAKAADRDATTASVVAAALDVHPASAVAVVGAIARQTPEAASAAAAKAAVLQPKNLSEIATAAASIAPGQAVKIVEALCKAMPTKYATIATAVAKAVPAASKEIMAALSTAVPALRPFVNRATSDLAKDASVGLVMNRTEILLAETAKSAGKSSAQILAGGSYDAIVAPPTLGPPFTELPTGGTTITRGDTKPAAPGGGRDYSGP